jgi:hypothetical protein
MSLRDDVEPRRWDRATWIRLALAAAPLVLVSTLAIIFGR